MSNISVELLNYYGDDLMVANAARVSFDKHHDKFDAKKDGALIGYLAQHNHWTPFAHPQATFRISCPIPIARQQFKSTVGFVYSEVSRRYVSSTPDFFRPSGWRKASSDAKQGSGDFLAYQRFPIARYDEACEEGLNAYEEMLAHGVAPEQARLALPQGMMTTFIVTGSLAAWSRFCNQRLDSHAQFEVRSIATAINIEMRSKFPYSWVELVGVDSFIKKESPEVIKTVIERGSCSGFYVHPGFSAVFESIGEDSDGQETISEWASNNGLTIDYYSLSENMTDEEVGKYEDDISVVSNADYGKIQRQGWAVMAVYHNEDGAWAIRCRPSYLESIFRAK